MSMDGLSRGHDPLVYIDSAAEQVAWMIASFGPEETWDITSQEWKMSASGERHEVLEIALANGAHIRVAFAEVAPDDSLTGEGNDRTGEMEEIMQRVLRYAEANPPHHPGSLPRFPVPSPSYNDALATPLAVLATDDTGVRSLYAPPRQVVIGRKDGDLVGVGEFPGFDPEHWPPPRLGPWPPPQLEGIPPSQLQAMIERFSACWSRVLEGWYANVRIPSRILREDAREGLHRRATLDLMEMLPLYERLNPVFAKWLNDLVGDDHKREETA